ncbi:MAG: hypothetical protein QM489_00730 [Candidatus Izemoplasma sp.]
MNKDNKEHVGHLALQINKIEKQIEQHGEKAAHKLKVRKSTVRALRKDYKDTTGVAFGEDLPEVESEGVVGDEELLMEDSSE